MLPSAISGCILAAGCLLATTASAFAQGATPEPARDTSTASDAFDLLPGGTYDPAFRTPAQLLGYRLGTRFTEHDRLVDAVRAYGQNERAVLEKYGETEQRRPLHLVYVSSPENLKNLAQVRSDLATLVAARTAPADAIRAILDRLPVIVWLSFNVHGNEPSSSEAALATLYQLVAGTDARTEAIRKSAIVVIDPCVNPDGRDRYVHWFNGIVGQQPDANPAAWEHVEPWPGGRVNHYYFDLNRDWAFLTQVETRSRIPFYLRTPPQVHVDFHEMGASSSYFFFPPVYPVNANLPADVVDWSTQFGRANAAAFDRFGWTYYTRENFDLFYPGYGDSWPTFQGAIGMTYEQAGHSSAGLALRRDDETLLTLRDRIWHHFIAAFATCETSAAQRSALVRRFWDWHRTAIEEGERGPVIEYVIPEGSDPLRSASLASLLASQGIQVDRAGTDFVAGPLRSFDGKDVAKEAFAAGTYLVPLAQPRKRLANALLEPAPQLRDLYFYDVTAWSLPRAFGLEAFQSLARIDVARAPYDGSFPRSRGIVGDPKNAYALLVDWRQGNAPRLAARLLEEGTRLSIGTKETRLGGTVWERGTLVIPVAGNGADLLDRVRAAAEETGVTVTAVPSGLADEGADLGSDSVLALKRRRVAVVAGPDVDATSFGAVRFLLERSHRIPFTIVPLERLGSVRLSDFGAIVFPDGYGYDRAVPKATVDRLRDWMTAGGLFVGLGRGGLWATAERSGLTRIRIAKTPEPEAGADTARGAAQEAGARRYVPADQREAEMRRRGNPGAILRLEVEPDSSVAFGCGDGPLSVLANGEQAFDPDPTTGQPAFLYTEDPRAAGFVGAEATRRLAGRAFAMSSRVGRGRAVLFSEDPNFRLVWQGLTKAFLNALLLPPIRD